MSSSSDIERLASDANSSKSREERTDWCDNRFDECGSTDMSLLAPWQILSGEIPRISRACLQLAIEETGI